MCVAVGGTAIAGSKISGKTIKKGSEPGNRLKDDTVTGTQVDEGTLGKVPSATNADTVGGKSASALQTSSGFNQNGTVIPSLGASFVDVASATTTTQSDGRVLATGSAELFGAAADEVGRCRIQIDGVTSLDYESAPDDIGSDNEFVIAVNFARSLAAGAHTATLQCEADTGTVGKDDAAINVYGLGS